MKKTLDEWYWDFLSIMMIPVIFIVALITVFWGIGYMLMDYVNKYLVQFYNWLVGGKP